MGKTRFIFNKYQEYAKLYDVDTGVTYTLSKNPPQLEPGVTDMIPFPKATVSVSTSNNSSHHINDQAFSFWRDLADHKDIEPQVKKAMKDFANEAKGWLSSQNIDPDENKQALERWRTILEQRKDRRQNED